MKSGFNSLKVRGTIVRSTEIKRKTKHSFIEEQSSLPFTYLCKVVLLCSKGYTRKFTQSQAFLVYTTIEYKQDVHVLPDDGHKLNLEGRSKSSLPIKSQNPVNYEMFLVREELNLLGCSLFIVKTKYKTLQRRIIVFQ